MRIHTLPMPMQPGPIRAIDEPESGTAAAFGSVIDLNPLEPGAALPASSAKSPGGRLVCWSGWTSSDESATRAENERFSPDFATWGPAGRASFQAFLAQVGPELISRGSTLCFRPHSAHALPDPQSCLNMLREHEQGGGGPFEVVLDPCSMLTPSMLDRAEDHLERAFEALSDRPDVPGLALVGVREHEDGSLAPVPLAQSVVPLELLLALTARWWPADKPALTHPQDGPVVAARLH